MYRMKKNLGISIMWARKSAFASLAMACAFYVLLLSFNGPARADQIVLSMCNIKNDIRGDVVEDMRTYLEEGVDHGIGAKFLESLPNRTKNQLIARSGDAKFFPIYTDLELFGSPCDFSKQSRTRAIIIDLLPGIVENIKTGDISIEKVTCSPAIHFTAEDELFWLLIIPAILEGAERKSCLDKFISFFQ